MDCFFCEAELTLFASFSGKRRISLDELKGRNVVNIFVLFQKRTKSVGSARLRR
jgi:hypothetical protein